MNTATEEQQQRRLEQWDGNIYHAGDFDHCGSGNWHFAPGFVLKELDNQTL